MKLIFIFICCIIFKDTKQNRVLTVEPFHKNSPSVTEDVKLQEENQMNHARFLNKVANITFIILLTIFNVWFWTIASLERIRPAEYYITRPNYLVS